jgi:hypothetical protein
MAFCMKPKQRRHRCLCCKELFTSDPRSRHHQEFCSKPPCQKASKALSQQRWLAKPENKNHWRGKEAAERVRQWRAKNPGYWRRKRSKSPIALQEDCPSQTAVQEPVKPDLAPSPLQENSLAQQPFIVGLISMLTDTALQEDIATTHRRLVAKGYEVLGMKPGARNEHPYEKTNPGSGALAPSARPI